MITKEQLEKIGLPDSQGKIYLSLLQKGPQFLQEISKNTGIKRTSLYLVIDQMAEKDLIAMEIIKKRKRYYIKNPKILLSRIKDQYYLLDALMPQLENAFEQKSAGNKIRFYDTNTGLKETLKEIIVLNPEKDELLTIEGDIRSAFKLGYDFWKDLLTEKKKLGIKSRTIIPSSEKDEFVIQNHKIQIRTSAMFDDFKIMLYLFSNKTVVMIPEDSLCIVIENIKVKNALTAMFEIIWKRSKQYVNHR
ncbi:MAG: helix-turn-helix domain-containing protein [Candidatus Moraniibacteriota bacterium]